MKKKIFITLISILVIMLVVVALNVYLNINNVKQISEVEVNKNVETKAAGETNLEVTGTWDVSEKQDGSVTAVLYSDGKMVISGNGNMINYAGSQSMPYKDFKSNILSVEIQQGVTSIGSNAFNECGGLTKVVIPEGVTNIARYTFYRCRSLTNIVIPEGVTNIGEYAFYYCDNLTNVKIPGTVTNIGGYAFYSCDSLSNVKISNGVTSIGRYAFHWCNNIKSIVIPNSVTSIGESAFYSKNNTKKYFIQKDKIKLSDFNDNVSISGVSKIINKDGADLKNTDLITTETKMQIIDGSNTTTYTAVVKGDTNGDGLADLKDILSINKHRLNKAQLSDAYLMAGDVNGDGEVDLKDLLQVNKYRLGKINNL